MPMLRLRDVLEPESALRACFDECFHGSPHFAGTHEYLTVQKGRVRVESGGDQDELNPGDSASYRADVPHAIVNTGRSEALIYLVDIYR
jgi:quercetin dioxygenase-like cupin family protein